jgi:hypothetical protein
MASRKPTKAANDADELLPIADAGDRITQFFDSLGADRTASVSVYEIDPKNRLRRSFLFTLPDARELSGPELMQSILEKHGAGEYQAEGRDPDTGQILFNPRFAVGSLRAPRAEIPGPARAPAAPGDTSSELAAAINRQSALLERLVAAQSAPPSMLGMLRELKELRDVLAPATPAAAPFDFAKIVELITGVLDLRDKLGDGGGDGGGALGILARSLAPALTKIAERAVDSPPALPAPARVTVTPPPAPPAEGADVGIADTLMLRTYVASLVRFAEQGLTPEQGASRVVETLGAFPTPTVARVVDWLNDEKVCENLAAIEPAAARHAEWLDKVVDLVLEAMLGPEPDDDGGELEGSAPPAANGSTQPAAG